MGSTAPEMTRFANTCVAMAPGTTNSGTGPANDDAPGYHNSRNRLLAIGRVNDYSIRYPWDQRGNGDRHCAFDWGHPTRASITKYTARVRDAYNRRDPRLTGWREVLGCIDGVLVGYNVAPNDFYFRTPDGSHATHDHFSVLREFVDERWVYDNMLSILRGESLQDWEGDSAMAEFTDRLAEQIANCDTYLWQGYAEMKDVIPIGANGIENKTGKTLKRIDATVQSVLGAVSTPVPVSVDAAAVAEALANNPTFITSLAQAIGDDTAARMASREI